MSPADVDVVIPAYNAARFLGEALDSVLSQQLGPGQVWVVDDGSADATHQVATRRLGEGQVLRSERPQSGPGAAVNLGLVRCRRELVAFCDADDVWLPGKLKLQLDALQQRPTCSLVFGQLEQFGEGRVFRVMAGVARTGMLARRSVFARVGGFREDLRAGEFIDWLARAEELGVEHHTLLQVLYRRRLHDDNLGRREQGAARDYLRLLKDALDRRRNAP